MRRSYVIRVISLLPVLIHCLAFSQTQEPVGGLTTNREHVRWPSPESLISDVRSQDDEVRYKAFVLLGFTPDVPGNEFISRSDVVKPDQVELRYAALGKDESKEAIVVVQYRDVSAIAAVAMPTANGWERLAVFSCWCKYDPEKVMDTFLSLNRAPDPERFELVVHASNGGTGLYEQTETHFRLYDGEMKKVISFVSRVREVIHGTAKAPQLRIEGRWFNGTVAESVADGNAEISTVLFEGKTQIPLPPLMEANPRELQDRYLKEITCTAFRWDSGTFEYRQMTSARPCR